MSSTDISVSTNTGMSTAITNMAFANADEEPPPPMRTVDEDDA